MTRARNLSKLSNTNILAVDSANQRVGIGTTNPKYPLHVVGVGSTSLFVDGSARITGVLSIGQGSVTINGSTNTITATNIVANNITADGNVGYATTGYVNNALVGYATQGYVTNSLVGYATESYVNNAVSTKISGVGIQSAGISVTTTAKTLNFIGAGEGSTPLFADFISDVCHTTDREEFLKHHLETFFAVDQSLNCDIFMTQREILDVINDEINS